MSVFCVGRFASWDSNSIIHTPHLARHELQEEARFARAVRDEDVLPRLRVARARGEQFVAAKHRVEECDELELRQSVADADTRTRAERAVRYGTIITLSGIGSAAWLIQWIWVIGRRSPYVALAMSGGLAWTHVRPFVN